MARTTTIPAAALAIGAQLRPEGGIRYALEVTAIEPYARAGRSMYRLTVVENRERMVARQLVKHVPADGKLTILRSA